MIAKIQRSCELQGEIWERKRRKSSVCKNWKIVPGAERDGEKRRGHSLAWTVERMEGNENKDENRR